MEFTLTYTGPLAERDERTESAADVMCLLLDGKLPLQQESSIVACYSAETKQTLYVLFLPFPLLITDSVNSNIVLNLLTLLNKIVIQSHKLQMASGQGSHWFIERLLFIKTLVSTCLRTLHYNSFMFT